MLFDYYCQYIVPKNRTNTKNELGCGQWRIFLSIFFSWFEAWFWRHLKFNFSYIYTCTALFCKSFSSSFVDWRCKSQALHFSHSPPPSLHSRSICLENCRFHYQLFINCHWFVETSCCWTCKAKKKKYRQQILFFFFSCVGVFHSQFIRSPPPTPDRKCVAHWKIINGAPQLMMFLAFWTQICKKRQQYKK